MSRKKKNNLIPLVALVGGGLLLIVAAVMLASQNSTAATTPNTTLVEEVYPEIARVSIDEAKAAFDSGSAVFVDVRSVEAYQASHISGAINIPSEELEARLGELDKAQWIITYCTWPSEETSARAASILLENGFQKATPILGGLEPWLNAGYPVQP